MSEPEIEDIKSPNIHEILKKVEEDSVNTEDIDLNQYDTESEK